MEEFSERLFILLNENDNHIVQSQVKEFESSLVQKCFSIKLCTHGTENYKINGGEYFLKPRTFILTKPEDSIEVTVKSNDLVKGICVYIQTDLLTKALNTLFSSGSICNIVPRNEFKFYTGKYFFTNNRLSESLLKLQEINNISDLDKESFYLETSYNLVAQQLDVNNGIRKLKSLSEETAVRLYVKVDMAKALIEQNFNEDLNIESIAELSGMSKFHFIRVFKTVYNETPINYLNTVRVEKAKNLIHNPAPINPNELAHRTGFRDKHILKKHFLKNYNYWPF